MDALLRQLVEAAQEGDGQALGELVRRTEPTIRQVCRSLASPGEEADLLQEVYLRAVKALPSYRGEAPVLAWLGTIARRTCADDVRRRQRRRRLIERVGALLSPDVVAPADVTSALLDGLDPDRRDAFVLTQLGGLTYGEAAEALGCPVGTVRSRVSRARAQLLERMAEADAV